MKNKGFKNNFPIPKLYLLSIRILPKINLYYSFNQFIFRHKKINSKNTILILGAPRSGTTWLMEIICCIPNYTSVFEPLKPLWFPESIKYGIIPGIYYSPNEKWEEGKQYLSQIFNGQKTNCFPIQKNNLKTIMQRLLANKIVVKSIRLNQMLPWINKNFNLRKILFIIRHPCAVIASQIKSRWCGYYNETFPYLDSYPSKEIIFNRVSKIDFLNHDIREKIKQIKTLEEILAVAWCLDNYILLVNKRSIPWTVISYESLVKNFKNEIINLFKEIGEEKIPKIVYKLEKKPTFVTFPKDFSKINNKPDQLSKWKKELTKTQIDNILNIVSYFGFNFYSENPEPDYDKFKSFLK